MSFLKPFVLFFLPLSLIPLLFHLLLPYKKRKIIYPWIDIFKKEKEIKKKRRIRDILVLLMRIFAIFFLIFSFSKPNLKSKYGNFKYVYIPNHPYYINKAKKLSVEFKIIKSNLSIFNKRDIFLLGPVPKVLMKKLISHKKNIYVIYENKNLKDIKITGVKNDEENLYIFISSNFDTTVCPVEIYSGDELILHKNLNIKKGENLFIFPFSQEIKSILVKINMNDIYQNDNIFFYFFEKIRGFKPYLMGRNKFIEGYINTLKKGKNELYFVIGSKNLKFVRELLNSGKKVILFPDTINEELLSFLNSEGFEFKGNFFNIISDNGEFYFKKLFFIKGRKDLKINEINFPLFSISENSAISSFFPSENITNFIFYPEFIFILDEVIGELFKDKIEIPESTIVKTDIINEDFILYSPDGKEIQKFKGKSYLVLPKLTRGIYFLKNSKKFVIEVNSLKMPDFANTEDLKSYENFKIIHNINDLKSKDLSFLFLVFSFLCIVFEIFLCVI